MANAKHEDAVMKMGFDYFRNTILKTLGIDYQYEEIGPTELVELTIQSLYMDFTSRSFFFIHAILFCSLLLRLLSFDFSLRIFLAQAGQYLDAPEPGTYSTPHTVQFLAGIAAHRFVGMICNSSTKPMNL